MNGTWANLLVIVGEGTRRSLGRERAGLSPDAPSPRARPYCGTVIVVTDGEAAPVRVRAPAPEAPASTRPMTEDPSRTVAVRPARMLPFQVVPEPMVRSRPVTNQTLRA